jgi:hypothetical protein
VRFTHYGLKKILPMIKLWEVRKCDEKAKGEEIWRSESCGVYPMRGPRPKEGDPSTMVLFPVMIFWMFIRDPSLMQPKG